VDSLKISIPYYFVWEIYSHWAKSSWKSHDLSQSFTYQHVAGCSVLFLSRPRSEGWPHHGRTFSIYLYPLSFWLTLPQTVLSMTCCLSRPCVVFLACVHLALFLALFLSPGNSVVSSWCDDSMLASSLWQCLTVPSLPQLCWEPIICFLCCPRNTESFSVLSSQRPQDVFLHSSWVSSFHSHNAVQGHRFWHQPKAHIRFPIRAY